MTKRIHTNQVRTVAARADGCEERMTAGTTWVKLRLCRTCGHAGCCDSSPGRRARAHFHATGHRIIEPHRAPKKWAWCCVHDCYLSPGELQPVK